MTLKELPWKVVSQGSNSVSQFIQYGQFPKDISPVNTAKLVVLYEGNVMYENLIQILIFHSTMDLLCPIKQCGSLVPCCHSWVLGHKFIKRMVCLSLSFSAAYIPSSHLLLSLPFLTNEIQSAFHYC